MNIVIYKINEDKCKFNMQTKMVQQKGFRIKKNKVSEWIELKLYINTISL